MGADVGTDVQGDGAGPDEAPGAKRPRIAVIPMGTTHEFWKAIHAGAQTAGAELGVRIIWKGPLKEDDRNEQIQIVETMIAAAMIWTATGPKMFAAAAVALATVACAAPAFAQTRPATPAPATAAFQT